MTTNNNNTKSKFIKNSWIKNGDIIVNDRLRVRGFTRKGELLFHETINRRTLPSRRVHDHLANKVSLGREISKMAENNEVAIVHGGRDCDGVETNGLVSILPATISHVERWITELFEWSEGPTWWEFETPTKAKKIEQSHRDRVMEAHEDGHAWSI
jgi:hypothetical protein